MSEIASARPQPATRHFAEGLQALGSAGAGAGGGVRHVPSAAAAASRYVAAAFFPLTVGEPYAASSGPTFCALHERAFLPFGEPIIVVRRSGLPRVAVA